MRKLISGNLKAGIIIPLFILAGIFYAWMLAITIPKVMSYSDGMKILDMMPAGYNADYVNTLLDALGEKGRNTYLYRQIPLDMIYPLLFGISLCLVLAYIIKRLGKFENPVFYLCIVPLFSSFFDYCENFGIIAILKSYPDNSNFLSHITNLFSILKSTTTTIAFTLLIVLLIILWIRKPIERKAEV